MKGVVYSLLLGVLAIRHMSSVFADRKNPYDWHSSIAELRDLVKMEQKMITDLINDITDGCFVIDILVAQTEMVINASTKFLGEENKRNGDHLKMRYNTWFQKQISYMQQTHAAFNGSGIVGFFKKSQVLPTQNDLDVVSKVLLNLQKSSSLKANDLVEGFIMETPTGKMLSERSCMGLANLACTNSGTYNAEMCHEWIKLAKLRQHRDDLDYSLSDTEQFLLEVPRAMEDYSRLCSASINDSYLDKRFNPALKCFLWNHSRHPLLVLQPVRAELLSVNPTVVLFYNVMSNHDISYIRNMSEANLDEARSSYEEGLPISTSVDSYRVAHNNWMDDPDDPVMFKLDRLLEAITRLSIAGYSEALQVANYAVGGHFKPHYDAFILDVEYNVIRKATFMYYLTNVKYGGATVFPKLNIAVRPVKGAALFWHNLIWNSGEIDKRTLHAACPVLLGNKWVANKWIHDNQEVTYQKHQYFV